ncbi:MAG: hypothetical protein JWN78_109 [Bacteroidota bacterium]|nr:hypothetical protein [Bacteroidota bacterium]
MKKNLYLILLLGLACIISCKKNSSTNPAPFFFPLSNCKLAYNDLYQSAGGGNTDTTTTSRTGDSIISMTKSYGLTYYSVYILDEVHKSISQKDYDGDLSHLSETYAYYLDNNGYIDSLFRTGAGTGLINYRDYITRNSVGQIIHEITDFITYGYDITNHYNSSGNIDYQITKSLYPGGPYNDSAVYTFKPEFTSNAPQYVLNELYGKGSKNWVATKTIYDRNTMALKKTITYDYIFDYDDTKALQISQTSGTNTVVQNFIYYCAIP